MENLQIDGWCTKEKGQKLIQLITEKKNPIPKEFVEIGVFGGSSLFYCAQAIKILAEKDPSYKGKIYGIDPWDKNVALEGWDEKDPNFKWWSELNFETIYEKFLKNLYALQLESYVSILKKPSVQAVKEFEDNTLDFIHIDGNHGKSGLQDVIMWIPKVKSKGLIIFDDTDWVENQEALKELKKYVRSIYKDMKWEAFEKL